MLIKQIRFENLNDDEVNIIPDFLEWLILQIYSNLNNTMNRRKIKTRSQYLLKVSWINWKSKNKEIDLQDLMQAIFDSFSYEKNRINTWSLKTNNHIMIPNTNTSIDRFIRFIEYGDANLKGLGIFSKLINAYKSNKLNTLWNIFTTDQLGYFNINSKLISD